MKHSFFILAFSIVFCLTTSCDSSGKGMRIVPESSGNINSLSVVVSNEHWEGSIGDTIRNILAEPVYGLPQEEPLFSMRQMPPQVFTDFATRNRTVLKIEKGREADVKFLKDAFARPQKLVLITGQTNQEIIEQLEQNAERIITAFKNEEIKENQRRIKKSLNKNNNIEESLGLTLEFPSAYRIAKEENGFFWIRKELKTGSMNLMLYEIPLDAISDSDEAINDIIKMRDSMGKAHIPGPIEGSYMITEASYTPFFASTIIDNKPTRVTRSTWEVKNAFMAGPFINYIIEDKVNDRLVVAEGFTFAPSIEKRNHMFELEAIIRSLKIK
ncbi:MAG: DUF4837 family protein [Flavobacteriaceae bacterium]|nr:DUF4837 family protein [Bacteroidia bacterium]MBT8286637.1 DUF4837 family protein [Bacteroidia bacterium]NNF75162.1 DUF4837 family protein [Flavobacteriaceae bacterium]NNK72178.1 DUF4837 family protein [Flavobacteriaceae bacterium]